MDQGIRNKLRNVVTQCRKLLEEAVSQVLQGQFGISASGKKDEVHVEDESSLKLNAEDQDCRRDLVAHLGHIQALGYKAKDALAQLVREIAFTHLNRLCAYKMMVLPFLSARPVEKGLQVLGDLVDVLDRVADRLRRPIQVQDQSIPQTLC